MAILVCKQISCNSFKNEITDKLILNIIYVYLDVRKLMTDVNLWLLYSNVNELRLI